MAFKRVLTFGTLVPKEGDHTLPFITLLASPLVYEATASRWLLKVITLGHISCNTWSTRHSLTLVTTGMAVQGTTKAGAGLQKQQMCRCLEDRA